MNDNGPWDFIGYWIIGDAIGHFLARNFRLIVTLVLIFLAYQYLKELYLYLASLF